jgi:hypothetical protein
MISTGRDAYFAGIMGAFADLPIWGGYNMNRSDDGEVFLTVANTCTWHYNVDSVEPLATFTNDEAGPVESPSPSPASPSPSPSSPSPSVVMPGVSPRPPGPPASSAASAGVKGVMASLLSAAALAAGLLLA